MAQFNIKVRIEKSHKLWWYRKLVGKEIWVYDFSDASYMVKPALRKNPKGGSDNIGLLRKADCTVLKDESDG